MVLRPFRGVGPEVRVGTEPMWVVKIQRFPSFFCCSDLSPCTVARLTVDSLVYRGKWMMRSYPCKFHGYSEMSWWKLVSSRLVGSGSYIDFRLHFKWVVFHGYFSKVCERNKPYLRKWSNLTCVTIQDGPLPVLTRVITPLIGVLTAVTWLSGHLQGLWLHM